MHGTLLAEAEVLPKSPGTRLAPSRGDGEEGVRCGEEDAGSNGAEIRGSGS